MSATGRGAKRRKFDNYPTPAWATKAFLDVCRFPLDTHFIEPACGEGAILKVLRAYYPEAPIDAADLRECGLYAMESGVLWHPKPIQKLRGSWDVCITNPPYTLALDFARWGVEHARFTALLLRLNFLEGQKRSKWLATHVPDVYVFAKRPSFTGKGTDASAYAWMVWHQGERSEGIVRILTGGK